MWMLYMYGELLFVFCVVCDVCEFWVGSLFEGLVCVVCGMLVLWFDIVFFGEMLY